MRVLVTGAAGFIGAAVAERLLGRGDSVVGIDNLNGYYAVSLKKDRVARVRAASGGERFEFRHVDFADLALEQGLADCAFERIVHLGAQPGVRYSLENPHAYVQANVVGHLNILELARRRRPEHLVYASSSSVYGGNEKVPFAVEDRVDHPYSLYAATKKADELMSETYAHLYRLPQTGLRFFTVYGPWGRPDMMPWIFTSKILRGEPIQVFNDGEMSRDFTYIDDIVDGVIASLDRAPPDDGRAKRGGQCRAPYDLQYRRQPARAAHEGDRHHRTGLRPQGRGRATADAAWRRAAHLCRHRRDRPRFELCADNTRRGRLPPLCGVVQGLPRPRLITFAVTFLSVKLDRDPHKLRSLRPLPRQFQALQGC